MSLSEKQIRKIAEEAFGGKGKDKFFKYLDSIKSDKGPKFTVDSKGGVKKNYKNGGAVMPGRGGKFKGIS
tara:strand:+ start:316 stop:525 length:210 start_codon:yes stop_codon:yes gene_type:complete